METIFSWKDFIFLSNLNVNPMVATLLEPIDCVIALEKIKLGLHEVLINAVVHGNADDRTKVIRVRRIFTPNWFIWQIQDEGLGLPVNERSCLLPDALEVNSGRGLFLINQCFDDVRWSRKGNRVQVAYRRTKRTFY